MKTRPALLAAAAPDLRAALALADQLERPGRDFGVNLDALWRSVGRPPAESPEDWLRLAAPLLDAVTAYRKRVDAAADGREAIKRPATWTVSKQLAATIAVVLNPADAELFEVGDNLTCETLAGVYVGFLDQCAERRTFTAAGRLRRGSFLAMVGGFPPFHCPDPIPIETEVSTPVPAPVG